ncbi:MAG TPA: glycosyltransferase, partial [Isosphaeraceae bacterium]
MTLFNAGGQKTGAQILASALALYATNSSLGGNAVTAYGFVVTTYGVGSEAISVGSNGAAFGVANSTRLTVLQLLRAVNAQAVNGSLFNGDSGLINMASTVLTNVNQTGDISSWSGPDDPSKCKSPARDLSRAGLLHFIVDPHHGQVGVEAEAPRLYSVAQARVVVGRGQGGQPMSEVARIRGGLASVIVDCTGSLPRTRRCIDALMRHTRRPWELIAVVDEGDVAAYLAGIGDAAPIHVEIVPPPGDSASFRHAPGLTAACGDYLVLIDDGTVVPGGWLDSLAALAEWDTKIGMVGPMLNDAAPPQRADGVEAVNPAALRHFSDRWRGEHHRQWITTDRLAASCFLIRRHVCESVADTPIRSVDDLTARVLGRGLSLAVIRELFIYHEGDLAAFGPSPGMPDRLPHLIPKGVPIEFPPIAVRTRPRDPELSRRPRVSLTMIVRDETDNLPDCLMSAEGLCDEVIIVDTGSTDGTPEIARSLGATVVPFAWVEDFAAARNAALDHATGRYAFWLDADDRIDAADGDRLRDLFARLDDSEPCAYVMKQLSAGRDGPATGSVADHVRLFPVRDDVRWTYRVHEQILPAITAAGIPIRWTEIEIGHLGYADAGLCARKIERNLRILRTELREKPGNALVLFNIGWAAIYRNEPKAALGYLRASLTASSSHDALIRKVYALIAQAHQMLGDPNSALAACIAGRSLAPDDAGLLFSEGMLRRDRGDLEGAEACWRQVLTHSRRDTFSIV